VTFTILGASGSIGSSLERALIDCGAQVYAPKRGDSEILRRPLGHVVYCVGLTADFRTRPFETVDAHVEFLRRLLEHGAYDSMLYLSSTRVYRGLTLGDEDTALLIRPSDPDDLYNASKLLGETLCLTAHTARTRVARISNVVGPGARAPSFVLSLVRSALETGTIRLEAHAESTKDYVDIRDVVDVLPRILDGSERIYNVASSVQTTHGEVAEMIGEITGALVAVDYDAPIQTFPAISTARVQREFGFSPRPLRSSLVDMVDTERALRG
jgi:nucleoside-diphosphate-sugar epimerase